MSNVGPRQSNTQFQPQGASNLPYTTTQVLPPQTTVIPGSNVQYGQQAYPGQSYAQPAYAQTASYAQPAVNGYSQVTSGQFQQQGFSQQAQAVSSTVTTQEHIKGESRIEYVPYERTVTEYEEVRRQVQVPITKSVTDYYAVQFDTEYIPQVFQEKIIEYVPVERIQERVEYQAVTTQNVIHQPNFQQEVQTTFVPQQSYITQQPQVVTQSSYITQQPQFVTQQPPQFVTQQPPQFVTQQPPQFVTQQPPQFITQQPQYVQQPPQFVTQQPPQFMTQQPHQFVQPPQFVTQQPPAFVNPNRQSTLPPHLASPQPQPLAQTVGPQQANQPQKKQV